MVEHFRLIFTIEMELGVFTTDKLSLLLLFVLHANPSLFLHSFIPFSSLITENYLRASLVAGLRSQNYFSGQKWILRFPWWFSGKESTCQRRRRGFNPWSGKIAHAEEQLSLCVRHTIELMLQSLGAAAPEPTHPRALLHDKRSQQNEKPEHRN